MAAPRLHHLIAAGRDLLSGLGQLVYPGCCLLCGQPLPPDTSSFCPACRHGLFADASLSCPRCAATVGPFAVIDGRCRWCRDESFRFEQALRLGPYAGLLRDVVLRLKHFSAEGLAELLGACWGEHAAAAFEGARIDAVVPVPLHWWRRLRRGYNQSAALAH
jgi:predicted amidophosphoribosyltransferase